MFALCGVDALKQEVVKLRLQRLDIHTIIIFKARKTIAVTWNQMLMAKF